MVSGKTWKYPFRDPNRPIGLNKMINSKKVLSSFYKEEWPIFLKTSSVSHLKNTQTEIILYNL